MENDNNLDRVIAPRSKDEIIKLQKLLKIKGYDLGKAGVDGIFGPKTKGALIAASKSNSYIRDTYIKPATVSPEQKNKQEVKKIQRMLVEKGYDIGSTGVDGIMGRKTREAYEKYNAQQDSRFRPDLTTKQDVTSSNVQDGLYTTAVKPKTVPYRTFSQPRQTFVGQGTEPAPAREMNIQTAGIALPGRAKPEAKVPEAKVPGDDEFRRDWWNPDVLARDATARYFPHWTGRSGALLLGDVLGMEQTITEHAISDEGRKWLADKSRELGPGRHAIGRNYPKTYGFGVKDLKSWKGINEVPGAPAEIATKLGQAVIDVNEDMTEARVYDQYNFNAKDEDSSIQDPNAPTRKEIDEAKNSNFFSKIKKAGKAVKENKDLYGKIRYGIAPVFGSSNSEGAKVRAKIDLAKYGEGGSLWKSSILGGGSGNNPYSTLGGIGAGLVGTIDGMDGKTSAFGDIASNALNFGSMGMTVGGPWGAALGGLVGAGVSLFTRNQEKKEKERMERQVKEEQMKQMRQTDQMNSQAILASYPTRGIQSSGFYKKGGVIPTQYQVEGGEVLHAGTPPMTDANGSVRKIAPNTFKFTGDRHSAPSGGIGVAGGNNPYTDMFGQPHSSGFVFSDSPDMKINPYPFLKYI